MESSTKESMKPLRDVEVDYEIDNSKCKICEDKPCLKACPVDATYIDSEDKNTKINEKCFGCVLCREACPYDGIKMNVKIDEPIKENIPNINPKLCKACGACVSACKTGAIHLVSSGHETVHSEIDEDKCVRCGYCFRSCPTDAIKYGEILPKTVSGGRAIVVNQKKCIGCMTCTKICPSKGAINVGKINKLPYIDPSYCARCEECMDVCPSTAIKYSSRKRAYSQFNKLKSSEIVSNIIEKDINRLTTDISKVDDILSEIAHTLINRNDKEFKINVTDMIVEKLDSATASDISVSQMKDLVEHFPPFLNIRVHEDKCIGCGECVDVCPVKCIWLEMPSPIHIEDECVFCGKCVLTCPVDSIEIQEEFFESRDDNQIFFIRRNIEGNRNGKFTIQNDICQSCGVCVNQCPVNALSLENGEIKVDQDLCISCRECETLCPVDAIKIIFKD